LTAEHVFSLGDSVVVAGHFVHDPTQCGLATQLAAPAHLVGRGFRPHFALKAVQSPS